MQQSHVERIETLRGPQGTLYGRNATGGVVNVITAKPVLEEFQADTKLTYGNYNTFKGRGMVNVPIGETLALRVAGSYLSRDGYVDNRVTGNEIDGRELYGIRGTLAWEPTDRFRTWLMVEHFEEDDSRIRSGKQLCDKDPLETSFAGIDIEPGDQIYTSLGCQEAPLSQSNDRVNTVATLGGGLGLTAGLLNGDANTAPLIPDLRTIESAFDPKYEADQTLYEFKAEFDLTDSLLLTYLGSYSESSVLSVEDYNKVSSSVDFNQTAGQFMSPLLAPLYPLLFPGGNVTDPQLGTANNFRSFDLSGGQSEQTTHELRLQSDFDGRFNFNAGVISIDFEAIDANKPTDGYYVLSNTLTALTQLNNAAGGGVFGGPTPVDMDGAAVPPILALSGDGRNYFRSISPYELESFAVFGESYIDLTDRLQLTVGLRYTDDEKAQERIPTFLFTPSTAVPNPLEPQPDPAVSDNDLAADGTYNVSFQETTGRIGLDWTPDLSFSEDTLLYAFYSRGYKGGGINPPQPAGTVNAFPQFFDPEFINSYELGTKNTFANGALQLNATGFYYDYEGYQISQIVNRTSANFNIDAEIKGLEFETIWNPVSTLVLSGNLGLLDTEIQDTFGVDVLDRTNGRDDLVVLKNAATYSNCVVSAQGYATILGAIQAGAAPEGSTAGLCTGAFAGQEAAFGVGDVTYVDSNGDTQTIGGLTPFDGEAKALDGNSIPGAPELTFNFGAEYTFEALGGSPWDLRLRGDYYIQDESFSRVWNTGRDRLESWENINLSLQLTNQENGLQFEIFGKNITDEEAITGAYLTDDSSGLFTNIFLNEPALYGVSVSKSW